MKALILAGGHGTRLWPITKNRAKSLLPLAGKPILGYILEDLEGMEDLDEIFITTNRKFEESFRNFLEGGQGNHRLLVEEQSSEDEKYGSIGAMRKVFEKHGKDDYLVIGGDNYFGFDMSEFVEFSKSRGALAAACYEVPTLKEASNYGVVDFNEKKEITAFEEKPDEPKSRMASTLCYYIPEEKMELFDDYVEYWDGKIPKKKYLDETGRFLEWVVERDSVYAFPFDGVWADIGTRESYLRAESEVKERGRLVKGEVEDCELGENVTVLEGSEIRNSELKNSIIFGNCEVENSTVENSIVGEDTALSDERVKNEIVG